MVCYRFQGGWVPSATLPAAAHGLLAALGVAGGLAAAGDSEVGQGHSAAALVLLVEGLVEGLSPDIRRPLARILDHDHHQSYTSESKSKRRSSC